MEILLVFRDKDSKLINNVKKVVENSIKSAKIEIAWKNKLSKSQFQEKDLIITIGGDGTFLSASHYVSSQLIMGVNSNPKRSAGFLTSINLTNLAGKLKQIHGKNYKISNYKRISARIFQKDKCILAENALNEIYIGNSKPQHVSIYDLKIKSGNELQKSSGILITTGTGSTAWYRSMGGKPFSKLSNKLKFIVREPLNLKIHKPRIKKGQIRSDEKIEVENKINHMILSIDSIREYKLKKNDIVEIALGEKIRVIV
ncbi:NAD(+)/NADH kinase [Candidatus Pacearchaeota archaeon]|nr:NAD(+)/NADH kinase [Candidatus Pacearchaeota archaeon]